MIRDERKGSREALPHSSSAPTTSFRTRKEGHSVDFLTLPRRLHTLCAGYQPAHSTCRLFLARWPVSWQAVQWALEQSPVLRTPAGKPDSTARFVLVALAEQSRGTPPEAFPSLAKLRYVTSLDMKTIQRATARLAASGLIVAVGTRGNGVTVWQLRDDQVRPASDRAAIDEEVEAHRERDRMRKRVTLDSGALSPEVPDFKSGGSTPSGALSPEIRGVKSGIPDAEPARVSKGTGKEPSTSLDETDGVLLHLPIADHAKDKSAEDGRLAFEAFWEIYPRRNGQKVGKKNAAREFAKALKKTTADRLMSATRRYAVTSNGFPKDAERFLRDEIWADLNDTPTRPAVNGPIFEGPR
jgi:hypothetical protein